MAFTYAIFSILIVSAISLIGAFILSFKEQRLRENMHLLIGLAAGALLGDAVIHLIPEALAGIGDEMLFGIAVLSGMLLFFILETALRWHHHHETHEEGHPEHVPAKPLGPLVLIGDGMHNVVDGFVIAASYMVSAPVGIATTIAVILHEIPQEIGDFSLLLHAGYTRAKALFFNFLSALTAIFGALAFFTLGNESFVPYAAAITAGGFIYIAAADLIPELHEHHKTSQSVSQFVALAIGIGLMIALALLEV